VISSKNEKLDALKAQASKQGALVRQLKADGAEHTRVTSAVEVLKKLKIAVEAEESKDSEPDFDREGLDSILLRRMVVVPSFEIHGGEKGLFDFGPVGCQLKDNILSIWKNHFILHESMLQIECTCLTSESVLKTSGHVDRFTDNMVKDPSTGACYRADKLLEDHIERLLEKKEVLADEEKVMEYQRIFRQADAYSVQELHELIRYKFEIKSPDTGHELSEPFPFNLMFATTIGPEGTSRGFLRPETAQGMFVNFKRLLDYNGGKLPFAAAQIGLGFRNEISPRAGLLRVREFCMAEIEHFVDENDKSHPSFSDVADLEITLFPSDRQLGDGKMISAKVGAAVEHRIIGNETLAYFMARTHLFLLKIGVNPKKLRFRQHLPTEMAHYASDCWDAEVHMSYGWIECVGHADRSCYDLVQHSNATGIDLVATRKLPEPKVLDIAAAKIQKGLIGKAFKKEAAAVLGYLDDIQMRPDEALALESKLNSNGETDLELDGETYKIERKMVSFTKATKTIHTETYYPHVIEPAFGIGRILYAVLEHSYYEREEEGEKEKKKDKGKQSKADVKRAVLGFKPVVAPVKCAVFPLQKKDEYVAKVNQLTKLLISSNLSTQNDVSSVAIGRRYARMDEIGVPFALTVDLDTLEGKGPTVRERDSTEQVRVPESELVMVLTNLCNGLQTWEQMVSKYGLIQASTE